MIPRLGLGWAFRILGIISCAVNLVCGNLLRDRNKLVGSRFTAFHLPLLRQPEFLLFLGWGIFSMLGYVALLFSLANFALSVGLSSHQGSIVAALLNLGQGLGRPFVGMFSDRFGRINIATLLTFLCGLFCLVIWIFADSMGVVCFFAVLVGTVAGTYWATVSPVLAEIIGLRDLPSGLSITWLTLVAPCTVSEAIALQLRTAKPDGNTSYLRVQLFTGFVYIGASLCLWLVRGWKVGELEIAEQRRESVVRETPLTNATEGEKQDRSAIRIPSTGVADTQIWTPFSLARRMVALKRV
jgi:MFS family permease